MCGTSWGHTGQIQFVPSITLIQACVGQPSSQLLEQLVHIPECFLGQ